MGGYDTKDLMKRAKEAIEKDGLVFVGEVISALPCARPTFYDHFPNGSNDLKEIKQLLYDNRISTKRSLREKWLDSGTASLQISLYKLLADEGELRRLDNGKRDQNEQLDKYIEKLSDALQPLPEAEKGDK